MSAAKKIETYIFFSKKSKKYIEKKFNPNFTKTRGIFASMKKCYNLILVPDTGLEPVRIAPPVPKTGVSANFSPIRLISSEDVFATSTK